ncbi:hypothetical protein [Actinoplanes aureus]|uniref:SHOCT domain-containing protein n=1 Tax=Actinoplanes aureus TaxID=2792083 RepID=A0A931G1F0_9ACTN|nr:hypothetical protein [Actinoplanes aureus]MBG0562289.1 hypothetical protein [Actinoplanes aureus]
MLVLVVLIAATIAAWTFALWPRARAVSAPEAVPAPEPAPAPKPVEPPPRAESTEGLLVAQLIRGDLTQSQYRKAMACLAERDETRHPLSLPGEG